MRIIATMLARSEAWCVRLSLEVALRWCDEVVFLNHASTDETRTIAAALANRTGRVIISDWPDEEHWREMDARQTALEIARDRKATHIAIIDADEVLTHNCLERVREWFAKLEPGRCLDLPMIAPWESLERYATDVHGIITLGFADLPELAWKPRGSENYHHHNRPPMNNRGRYEPLRSSNQGGVFHLQWADIDRKRAKDDHYMMSELVRWNYRPKEINDKYSWWRGLGNATRPIELAMWGDYDKTLIRIGEESWYLAECSKMLAKYGEERFAGLDLWRNKR